MKKILTLLAVSALASFVLAACGSSSNDSTSTTTSTSAGGGGGGGGSAETVQVTADPSGQLAFTKTQISAKAGQANVEFINQSPTGHDLVLQDSSGGEVGKTDVITGSTASFTADLKPGSYTYFCSLPGHEDAGMKGTLTVK